MHLCYLARLTFEDHGCQDYEKSSHFVHWSNILTTASPVCQFGLQKAVFSPPLVGFNKSNEIISLSRGARIQRSKPALNQLQTLQGVKLFTGALLDLSCEEEHVSYIMGWGKKDGAANAKRFEPWVSVLCDVKSAQSGCPSPLGITQVGVSRQLPSYWQPLTVNTSA